MADIVEKLISSVSSGRARHAYLLAGADKKRADEIARGLAAIMLFGVKDTARLADEPDYMEYDGGISIAQFRNEIQPEIFRETYGKSCRVVCFRSADLLSQMVQNAMLKVLEEPPENTRFILTGNEYGILPTIRSRCTVVRFPRPALDEIASGLEALGASREEAVTCAASSGQDTGRAERLYRDEQYRVMRRELYTAFIRALNGAPDYKFTKQKRERGDWAEACELLLLFAHDMLCAACGLEPEHCRDFAGEIKKLSLHFTIGDIGCIIDRITGSAVRTATNASGGAVFDRLFSETAQSALSRDGSGRR